MAAARVVHHDPAKKGMPDTRVGWHSNSTTSFANPALAACERLSCPSRGHDVQKANNKFGEVRMTKGLPDKARVATVSRVRKSAMMGAAATALIAAAPAFSADATTMELQAAIRSILHTPVKETSWREKVAAPRETPTAQRDLHRQ